MNWGRYIKRTAVRRVIWIVVGVAVYSAFGVARAQSVELHDSRAAAYSACNAVLQQALSAPGVTGPAGDGCTHALNSPWGFHHYSCAITHGGSTWSCNHARAGPATTLAQWRYPSDSECPAGTSWNEALKQCLAPCQGLSPLEGNVNTSRESIVPQYCVNECTYQASNPLCHLVEGGPTAGYWCNVMYNPTGAECTGSDDVPNDPNAPGECAADEVRLPDGKCSPRGQCPLGQHEVNGACHPTGRCPSYHVKAPDGSCTPVPCPSGQARGEDGTCKSDDNSDGTPDEDEPGGDGTNTDGMEFSGGQSCSVPPTCSGDSIMCGQARIQWQIECNTRRAESVEGGNACDQFNMPICVGDGCDPVEHKQLIIQWQAMCALRDLVSQDGDGVGEGGVDLGGVEDRLDGIGGFLTGDGSCLASEEGCGPGGEGVWEEGDPDGEEWSSGLSSTGSCPAPISTTVSLGGYNADVSFSYQPICDFAALMRWVLIAGATIMSGFIVAGVRTS